MLMEHIYRFTFPHKISYNAVIWNVKCSYLIKTIDFVMSNAFLHATMKRDQGEKVHGDMPQC